VHSAATGDSDGDPESSKSIFSDQNRVEDFDVVLGFLTPSKLDASTANAPSRARRRKRSLGKIGSRHKARTIRPLALGNPWQNGVAERWVQSCRRDLLDHVIRHALEFLRRAHFVTLKTRAGVFEVYLREDQHIRLPQSGPVPKAGSDSDISIRILARWATHGVRRPLEKKKSPRSRMQGRRRNRDDRTSVLISPES